MLAKVAGLLIGALVLTGGVQDSNGRIEGLVKRADTGAPISGCLVSAGRFNGNEMIRYTGNTDNSGRFVIEDVTPGDYSVIACAGNNYSVPPGGKLASSVAVGASQRVSGVTISLLPIEGVISGRVVDLNGNPLPGVQVQALTESYENGRLRVLATRTATTNDRGEYRIISLIPGKYYVRTNISSRPDGINTDTFFPGVSELEMATSVLVKRESETTKIDFTNQAASLSTISGKVVFPPSITGVGTPVLRLHLLRRDKKVLSSEQTYRATTDSTTGAFTATGRFTIGEKLVLSERPILPGSYYLFAWLRDAPSFESAITSFGLEVPGIRLSHPTFAYYGIVPVDVRAGQNIEDVTITLQPTVGIQGKVVLTEGDKTTELESLRIAIDPLYLEPDTLIPTTLLSSNRMAPAVPDRAGTFTLPKFPEGHYGIRIGKLPEDAYVADILQGNKSVYDHGFRIAADSANSIELLIKPKGGIIQGMVMNIEEKGMPYVTVVLVPDTSRRTNFMFYKTAVADAAGAFTFRGVVPGEYRVFAWEENLRGAFQSPDFIEANENRGTPVEAREAETVENVSVRLIPETP